MLRAIHPSAGRAAWFACIVACGARTEVGEQEEEVLDGSVTKELDANAASDATRSEDGSSDTTLVEFAPLGVFSRCHGEAADSNTSTGGVSYNDLSMDLSQSGNRVTAVVHSPSSGEDCLLGLPATRFVLDVTSSHSASLIPGQSISVSVLLLFCPFPGDASLPFAAELDSTTGSLTSEGRVLRLSVEGTVGYPDSGAPMDCHLPARMTITCPMGT